jgi:hypothetical protein
MARRWTGAEDDRLLELYLASVTKSGTWGREIDR